MSSSAKNFLLLVVGVFIGVVLMLLALRLSPTLRYRVEGLTVAVGNTTYDDILNKENSIRNQFNALFNDAFTHKNPFDEMKRMKDEIENRAERFGGGSTPLLNPFDTWFSERFGTGTVNDISQHEDQDYVYYDIKVSDLKATDIATKVENGYISVSGVTNKRVGTNRNEETFSSTFLRTFPLPTNVDANKMELSKQSDILILKFPKIKI